jgi:hypothetical protein
MLPLQSAPADFAVINAYSLTIGSTLAGIRVLNSSNGSAFNGTVRNDPVEPLTPLRGATLPSPVIDVFLVGSAYNEWSVATVTSDNRLLMVPGALPDRAQLKARALEIIDGGFEPHLFCFNRSTIVALSAFELFVGAPRWSTSVAPDTCSEARAAATLSGDIALATESRIMLIDGASGRVLATDPRGALNVPFRAELRVLPRTSHIHVSFVAKNLTTNTFIAQVVVFDDQLQFVRNVSLFPEEAATIANISNVSTLDIMINPITGDKFVTVGASPNAKDNRLFAWPCNATADAAACAPPPPPITRFRPTTTTTTTASTTSMNPTNLSPTSLAVGTSQSLGGTSSEDSSSNVARTGTQSNITGSLTSASIGVPAPTDDDNIWAPPSGIGFVIACGVGGGITVVAIALAAWFACRRRNSTSTRRGNDDGGAALLQDHDHR